jgi:hypothetical protein
MILRSTVSDVYSVSINQGGADDAGLFIGIFWWPAAFGLAPFYMFFIGKNYRGKVKPSQDTQGFY